MKLAPGITDIDYGFVRSYLVECEGRLTLVDTGVAHQAERVLDEVRQIGRAPRDLDTIVITHAHVDHTGSCAELAEQTGARVLAHRLDAPVIRGEAEICPPVLSELERPYLEQANSRVVPAPPCRVDVELEDGMDLDLGGGASVIHVPGHTPGSIAVYMSGLRTLFCGDAVASLGGRPILGFFNCDTDSAARSFLRLSELDFDVECFGHGEALVADAATSFRRLAERIAKAI
jgi:glyoxylase-like metal-dependent hydrolase (beta-lactamase superfamily II)